MAIDTYFGNTPLQYAVALLIFAITVLVVMFAKKAFIMYSVKFAKKSRTLVDDAIVAMVETINAPFYWFASFVFASQYLMIDSVIQSGINKIFLVWLIIQVIIAVQIFVDYLILEKVKSTKAKDSMVSGILSGIIKIGLWLTAVVFVLSNFGINVTSLIAGLGIGGIAIALAAQNVLGDLFSSLAIYFDRPFAIGDFIVVGDVNGTVQKIGIKTTRIKALSGEEIIIPNKDIAAARVSNYRRMQERRAVLSVAVPYGLTATVLEKIPGWLEQSVDDAPHARYGNSYLKTLGPSAIMFELVYFIDDSDYGIYLRAKQQIILNTVRLFASHKVSLVAPGQTIKLGGE
ncbi:MAG: mechanosensitive ion channel family protein [Candidatus Andersenbacteria bacterium]